MANTKNVIPPIRGSFEAVARALVRPVARAQASGKPATPARASQPPKTTPTKK